MIEFLLHGATLALAWFLLVNLACSARRWSRSPAGSSGDATRAESPAFWLALRAVLPAAVARSSSASVFVPSYWRYEPREFVEGFDVTLTRCCALGAAALLARGRSPAACARGVRAARRTRVWMRVGAAARARRHGMPAFEIDADAPLMALVGVLRPRLLVTRGAVDALTDEELARQRRARARPLARAATT